MHKYEYSFLLNCMIQQIIVALRITCTIRFNLTLNKEIQYLFLLFFFFIDSFAILQLIQTNNKSMDVFHW